MKKMKTPTSTATATGNAVLRAYSRAVALLILCAGCARFTTTQTDTRYDDQGKKATVITTKAASWTFFESKSSLANFKAMQTEKSQTASVGSLTLESTSTNVVAVLEAVNKIVQSVNPSP